MSAWVVSKHHIDLLVSAAIDQGISIKLENLSVPETATEENAQAIGAMLWAENIRSVVYRYSLSGKEEERQYQQELNEYRFSRYEGIRASATAAALALSRAEREVHPVIYRVHLDGTKFKDFNILISIHRRARLLEAPIINALILFPCDQNSGISVSISASG
jgi:hypothetical protein